MVLVRTGSSTKFEKANPASCVCCILILLSLLFHPSFAACCRQRRQRRQRAQAYGPGLRLALQLSRTVVREQVQQLSLGTQRPRLPRDRYLDR